MVGSHGYLGHIPESYHSTVLRGDNQLGKLLGIGYLGVGIGVHQGEEVVNLS